MTDLVQDRDPDLPLELVRVGKSPLERPAVDDDPVWKCTGVVATRPQPVVPAEEVRLVRALVLDDDGDVLERDGDLLGEVLERRLNVVFEGHQ